MPDQTTAVDRFLDAVRTATTGGCDAWPAGAVLDATVPMAETEAVDAR